MKHSTRAFADSVGKYLVGRETADLLLLLQCITIGIGRYGEPIFGIDRHGIVDKLTTTLDPAYL